MAAQAGVRYSIEKPMVYIDSNIVDFVTYSEASIKYKIKHFVYASSSSVYGSNVLCHFLFMIMLIILFHYMRQQKNQMS